MVGKEDDRLSYLGETVTFQGRTAVKLREGGNDLEHHFVPFLLGNWMAGFRAATGFPGKLFCQPTFRASFQGV